MDALLWFAVARLVIIGSIYKGIVPLAMSVRLIVGE
jgi:hypothetical protein